MKGLMTVNPHHETVDFSLSLNDSRYIIQMLHQYKLLGIANNNHSPKTFPFNFMLGGCDLVVSRMHEYPFMSIKL